MISVRSVRDGLRQMLYAPVAMEVIVTQAMCASLLVDEMECWYIVVERRLGSRLI